MTLLENIILINASSFYSKDTRIKNFFLDKSKFLKSFEGITTEIINFSLFESNLSDDNFIDISRGNYFLLSNLVFDK